MFVGVGRHARSVQEPESAEDLFDQLDNFQSARDNLREFGLLSLKIATALDDFEAEVSERLAGAIRFDPGQEVRLVDHDGKLFAYAELAGKPSFSKIVPMPAWEIDLGGGPAPDLDPLNPAV